jgi:hypothetical protein
MTADWSDEKENTEDSIQYRWNLGTAHDTIIDSYDRESHW